MKTFFNAAFAGLVLMLLTLATSAQAQKIAVLDSREILAKLPEAEQANAKVQTMQKMWLDSLQMMKSKIEGQFEAYKKILDTMTPEGKQKAEADVAAMQDSFNKYRESKFGQEGELAQIQASNLKPIIEKTTAAIASVAKRDKYSIVFDKANGTIVYSDAATDITSKVLDFMKK